MRKKQKAVVAKSAVAVVADAIAAAVPAVVVDAAQVEVTPAVLTKRNRVPTSAVLDYTGKKVSDRADHNKVAWDVVAAALPATATELVAALEAAKLPEATQKKLVSFAAYLSYMVRRGALAVKVEGEAAK